MFILGDSQPDFGACVLAEFPQNVLRSLVSSRQPKTLLDAELGGIRIKRRIHGVNDCFRDALEMLVLFLLPFGLADGKGTVHELLNSPGGAIVLAENVTMPVGRRKRLLVFPRAQPPSSRG